MDKQIKKQQKHRQVKKSKKEQFNNTLNKKKLLKINK